MEKPSNALSMMNEEGPQGSSKPLLVHIRTTMGITATRSRDKNSSQCTILMSQEISDFLRNSKEFIYILCCILGFPLSRMAGIGKARCHTGMVSQAVCNC